MKGITGGRDHSYQQAHPEELEFETPIWMESDISGILCELRKQQGQRVTRKQSSFQEMGSINAHIGLALLSKSALACRLESLLDIDSLLRRSLETMRDVHNGHEKQCLAVHTDDLNGIIKAYYGIFPFC